MMSIRPTSSRQSTEAKQLTLLILQILNSKLSKATVLYMLVHETHCWPTMLLTIIVDEQHCSWHTCIYSDICQQSHVLLFLQMLHTINQMTEQINDGATVCVMEWACCSLPTMNCYKMYTVRIQNHSAQSTSYIGNHSTVEYMHCIKTLLTMFPIKSCSQLYTMALVSLIKYMHVCSTSMKHIVAHIWPTK